MGPFRLALAAELTALPHFRELVTSACRHAGLPEQLALDMRLVVDEACSAIIVHGYAGLSPGSIILEVHCEPQRVVLDFTDFGRPFEPTAVNVDSGGPIDSPESAGFLFDHINQLMDKIDYGSTIQGNRLRLVKRIRPPSTGA